MARRANAVVLLDQGWSCERVAAALLLDDNTVRDWYRAYERGGVAGLKSFGHEGSSGRLGSAGARLRAPGAGTLDEVGGGAPHGRRILPAP